MYTGEHANQDDASTHSETNLTPKSTPAKVAPKSWADLVRTNPSNPTSDARGSQTIVSGVNGLQNPKATSVVEVLRTYDSDLEDKRVAFIEPRGLVNTGNMCYMNAVCFYDLG